jgi:hypothetical protein
MLPLAGGVSACQRFREHCAACCWLSDGPCGLSQECETISPRNLYGADMHGPHTLGERLAPLLGLSLAWIFQKLSL